MQTQDLLSGIPGLKQAVRIDIRKAEDHLYYTISQRQASDKVRLWGCLSWEINRDSRSFTFWQAVLLLAQVSFLGVVRKAQTAGRLRKRLSSSWRKIKVWSVIRKKCSYSYMYHTGEEVDQKVIKPVGWRTVEVKEDLRSVSKVSWNTYKSWRCTIGDF